MRMVYTYDENWNNEVRLNKAKALGIKTVWQSDSLLSNTDISKFQMTERLQGIKVMIDMKLVRYIVPQHGDIDELLMV